MTPLRRARRSPAAARQSCSPSGLAGADAGVLVGVGELEDEAALDVHAEAVARRSAAGRRARPGCARRRPRPSAWSAARAGCWPALGGHQQAVGAADEQHHPAAAASPVTVAVLPDVGAARRRHRHLALGRDIDQVSARCAGPAPRCARPRRRSGAGRRAAPGCARAGRCRRGGRRRRLCSRASDVA